MSIPLFNCIIFTDEFEIKCLMRLPVCSKYLEFQFFSRIICPYGHLEGDKVSMLTTSTYEEN